MTAKLLTSQDLGVNSPIKWHIFDHNGVLLYKKGTIFHSDREIREIIADRAFIATMDEDSELSITNESLKKTVNPFNYIEKVLKRLDNLYKYIVHNSPSPKDDIEEKLHTASRNIVELCKYDMDATLGSIHIGRNWEYTTIHPLHCAIISYALATKTGITGKRLRSIICAALTANLGMLELQGKLVNHGGPLSRTQRIEVEKHTMRSAVLLKRIGTEDKLWIEIVLQHHERQDGTGYPRKLANTEFIREARILAIADRYHAMLSPRNYRDGLSPTEALKRIFLDRGKEVDEQLSASLIREMGIYPPGSFVKLANDESAIITRRGENKKQPLAKAVMSPEERVYGALKPRDCNDKEFRIVGLSQPPENFYFDLAKLWDY